LLLRPFKAALAVMTQWRENKPVFGDSIPEQDAPATDWSETLQPLLGRRRV